MTCTYCVNTRVVTDEEGRTCTVYGIDALSADRRERRVLRSIPDIFNDPAAAEALAARCNALQLQLVHLRDVIEDALA